MKQLKYLAQSKNSILFNFPAYVSLFARHSNHKLYEAEKKSTMKLSLEKTYSCNPLVGGFYKEADNVFRKISGNWIKIYLNKKNQDKRI